MSSTTPKHNLARRLAAPDPIALTLVGVVEALAASGLFERFLTADIAAGIAAGLLGAASVVRSKLAENPRPDYAMVLVAATVGGLAAAGVFAYMGMTADHVAQLLGALLGIAALVRMKVTK